MEDACSTAMTCRSCYITRKYSKLYCELPLDLSWPSTEQRGHMRTACALSQQLSAGLVAGAAFRGARTVR